MLFSPTLVLEEKIMSIYMKIFFSEFAYMYNGHIENGICLASIYTS